MSLLKWLSVVSTMVFLSANHPAYAKPLVTIFSVIPFTNIFLPSGDSISATYVFGIYNTIFCYENNLQTVGIFTWPLLTQRLGSTLPIFLKLSSQFQGSFANPFGFVTVTNNTLNTLIVSCQFAS